MTCVESAIELMLSGIIVLGLMHGAFEADCEPPKLPPLVAAQVLGAEGLGHLRKGDLAKAEICIEHARKLDPKSRILARDLAIVRANQGRFEEALQALDVAMSLGDTGDEVVELKAMLLHAAGRFDEARVAAASAQTPGAMLLGVASGDHRAARDSERLVDERSSRGSLSALVLAAHAAQRGERREALELSDMAAKRASDDGSVFILNGSSVLRDRLGADPLRTGARVRAAFEHDTNPLFETGAGGSTDGMRFALGAEGALHFPVAGARLDAALQAVQRVHANDRAELAAADLLSMSAAAALEIPISEGPDPATVGFALRFRDTFGDAFAIHYATTLEGGASLKLPFLLNTSVVLSLLGVTTDFIDTSPPDAKVSSLNRDFSGQRAIGAIVYDVGWVRVRAETGFLRDAALGDAFDAVGGVFGAGVDTRVFDGYELSLGSSVLVRELGPVGDESVVGESNRRLEARVALEACFKALLADPLWLIVEDAWMANEAKRLRNYRSNVATVGLEMRW